MRRNVSLLIGSGFSIPDGLPCVNKLNDRLAQIDESEIMIHTSQAAFFLRGQQDLNRWANQDERLFVQEFLKFYNLKILNGEPFHYETFYDFYSEYLRFKDHKEEIEPFVTSFNEEFLLDSMYRREPHDRISAFNRTFNQLIASELHKSRYFEDVSLSNYPRYDSFTRFLKELSDDFDVKIHSLNHDIFLEFLGHHHEDLWENFTDGYEINGSPCYGTVSIDFKDVNPPVHKSYYVKLPYYTGNYESSISLYKLHGSITSQIIYTTTADQKILRIKDDYRTDRYFIEVVDSKTGKYELQHAMDQVDPDFLTGTTEKMRRYTEDEYYKNLFQLFKTNLTQSDCLVVIGYGFQDPGINEYLTKNYLNNNKPMHVVDIKKPDSELMNNPNVNFIQRSITEVPFSTFSEIKSTIVV